MKLPSLQNILIGKEYVGIEHYTLDGEDWTAFLTLEKRKNELEITQNGKQIFSDSLPKRINKKLPVCLIVNTNQVLHKETLETNLSDEKLLHRTFPNLSLEEFFYEIWQMQHKTIVAVARKKYVNDIVDKYTDKGISISSINLGICSISEISEFITNDTIYTNIQKITFSDKQILFSNEKITQNSHHKINGLTVQNNHVLAFSGILQFLFKSNNTRGNLVSYGKTLKDKFLQQSFFKKGIQTSLGILLVLLFVNFLLFNLYYSKTLEINELSELNMTSLERVNTIKKRIVEKEKLANSLFNKDGYRYSTKINTITKSIPNSILLIQLTLNPLDKNIKEGEKITVKQNTITISGTAKDNNEFSKWIETLEKRKFIDNVVINQFGKNDLLETTFTLKLILI